MNSSSNRSTGAKSRRLPLLLGLAAGALVVAILCLGLGILIWLFAIAIPDDKDRAAASATHAAFELALEDVRIGDAYALTSARFQQEISFDGFRDLLDRYPIVKGRPGKLWTKGGKRTDHKSGSHESTYYTDVTSDGHVVSFTYVIVVEQGQARVDSLTFR